LRSWTEPARPLVRAAKASPEPAHRRLNAPARAEVACDRGARSWRIGADNSSTMA
jgi:hypothetical protein